MDESNLTPKQTPAPTVGGVFEGCCGLGFTLSVIVLGLLIPFVYTHQDSNHTSFSPWNLSVIFLPTALVGFLAIRRNGPHPIVLLALLSGVGGMVYLYYLDHSGRLISYMEWIWRSKNHL